MKRQALAVTVLALLLTENVRADPSQPSTVPAAPETSATGPSFSVETAIAAMRRAHPLLRAATASIRAAEGNAVTAGHWSNPLLDASYLQAVRNSSYDPVGTPNLGVTQFLELAGTPSARRRSAGAEVRATQADRDAVGRELEWRVRETFIRLATSYERQRIQKDAIANLEHASTIVKARVGGGLAPRYDASRIQIALEQAHADFTDSEADTMRARGDFEVAVGPDATELVGMPSFDPAEVTAAPTLAASMETARTRRPDIVAARHRVDASSADIEVARRSVFPGIALRLGAGFGQSRGQLDVGGGVIVPLPILERGQGSVAAAEARADGNRYVTEALTTEATQRVQAAHAEYVKRLEALARFRSQTNTVSDGMRAEAEAGYREAKLSVLELVDAYHSLRDVRQRLLDLEEAAHLARVSLGRAVGAMGQD